jgi:uncharacterized membrane-anchored protein YhcB (DUF1043 family)
MNFDWLVAAGAMSLGILIGVLVACYTYEKKKWDENALRAAISALLSTGAFALFNLLGGPKEVWAYPIGLLVGFPIGVLWEYWEEYRERKGHR